MKRNTTVPRTLVREEVHFSGSFAPNGSSAVSNASNKGLGWTVARTSTGLFTITFSDQFAALQSAICGLQLTTGDDQKAEIGVVSLANRTVQIRVWDISAAAVADIAADAGNRINFHIVFRNSAAKPEYGA